MATQYAIREDEHETRQIKRARATRRMQDSAFLRSLYASYPHLRPVRHTPDFSWVNDLKVPEKKVREVRADLIAQHRERVAAHQQEFRKNKPIGRAIIESVADWFELSVGELIGNSRKAYDVSARMVAIRLLRDVTWDSGHPRFSYPQIGSMLGGRDHSTVIHAITTFDDRARKYGEMTEAYKALKDA